ncbi:MAG: uroporphyrinogen-III synthase [Sphingomonas sp.]|nr:uroporphyrinogen-III synthase [Sphingomonas sp.]
MRRLIILRPEPGASATAQSAKSMGLDPLAMPLFEIQPIAWQAPEPAGFDGLLLTSANAVRQAGETLRALRGLKAYVVGEATAAAARRAGLDIACTGDAGVQRLLGSIDSDVRLLHLCGEHRTGIAAKQIIAVVPVYRSAELPPPGDLPAIAGATVAVHSPRAGKRLAELVDQARIDRRTVRIAAISGAAASAAGPGWEAREAANTPDERALLALAARLCEYCCR